MKFSEIRNFELILQKFCEADELKKIVGEFRNDTVESLNKLLEEFSGNFEKILSMSDLK